MDVNHLKITSDMYLRTLTGDKTTVRREKLLKQTRRLTVPSFSIICKFRDSEYVKTWLLVTSHLAGAIKRQDINDETATEYFSDTILTVDRMTINLCVFTPGPHTAAELRDLLISLLAGEFNILFAISLIYF